MPRLPAGRAPPIVISSHVSVDESCSVGDDVHCIVRFCAEAVDPMNFNGCVDVTENAVASPPENPQFATSVSPAPDPPDGVTAICPVPGPPGVTTPVNVTVELAAGLYASVGGMSA